jgi:hypothetical protein
LLKSTFAPGRLTWIKRFLEETATLSVWTERISGEAL